MKARIGIIMTILEILQLRATREPLAHLIDEIRASATRRSDRAEVITIMYRRVGQEADLTVNINRMELAG